MICFPLYRHLNFEALKREVQDLLDKRLHNQNQIMCQSYIEDDDNWYTGIGSIEELEIKEEKSYKFINKSLKDTEIEKLIVKHNGFRTRIMAMPPRQCYSIHADPTPRIHIPIVTSDQCWMIWPTKSSCFQLKEGSVYWTNTKIPHTFVNGSKDEYRIHIVMCVHE
jgi:hypothetical protein